jgi:MYXO-CTERM domain-containing protein
MNASLKSLLLGAATLVSTAGVTSEADACGGFFCSQSQPVNQAAERIIFANNGDGTVTAVIQIMYEGPSENFSWLLPISTAPAEGEIGVASDLAFQRLQSATNPQYTLNTVVEGTCRSDFNGGSAGTGSGGTGPMAGTAGSGGTGATGGGVNVEGSGSVGPFNWVVISVPEGTEDPATVATDWLTTEGYDVPSTAPGLLAPYLEDGLFLLALQLTKGTDSGSIRPISLTYDASKPMIPVKLTAVAANDDMGVMTWLLGDSRAVPENYLSLELNEARINWFNANSNYNQVVIEAADAGDGRGFVTEFAGPTTGFSGVVWQQFEEQAWQSFRSGVYDSFELLFNASYYQWAAYDGYWDAVRAAVTLPADVAFADFQLCPNCYSARVTFAPSEFMTALEENVIEPMRSVQNLIDAHPQMTRLYTTLSAEEMIVDPLFTFNPDLPEISNVHTATRVIECAPSIYQWEAPWRIELPQGGAVRGTPSDANSQTWPGALDELPPNIRITRQAGSGSGQVLEDHSDDIHTLLEDYNSTIPAPEPSTGGASGSAGTAGSGGSAGSDSGGVAGEGSAGETNETGGTPGEGGTESQGSTPDKIRTSGGGCAMSQHDSGRGLAWAWAIAGLAAYVGRRRKR